MSALMVQGTTSDAGKSTLVCALARILAREKQSVAPFKPQNMALNSAVTADGGEIGRAQALQAQACWLEPSVHMNPILLKPNTDIGSQVIVQGKALANMQAQAYQAFKPQALAYALNSYQTLKNKYKHILIEGAGSPAEINLREHDLANMGFAEAVDCAVIIVADIDRGGVFAHLLGTMQCLSQSEKKRVKGFIINRFRGDATLLTPAIDWLQQQTGKPVLAVLPYLHHLQLDAEDALNLSSPLQSDLPCLKVVIPILPRISNHTDFDALRAHPQVEVQFVGENQPIPAADLVIMPGSKNSLADLAWLKLQSSNWSAYLQRHLRYGGKLLGICGGLQMLGQRIDDPLHIEGQITTAMGFGLLNINTKLQQHKTLKQCHGMLHLGGQSVSAYGYEVHAGVSTVKEMQPILFDEQGTAAGWISADEQVVCSYWHGLLDNPDALNLILRWANLSTDKPLDYAQIREQQLNRLADCVNEQISYKKLLSWFA